MLKRPLEKKTYVYFRWSISYKKSTKKYREKKMSHGKHQRKQNTMTRRTSLPIDITWLIAQEVDSVKAERARRHCSKP